MQLEQPRAGTVTREQFGETPDGRPVNRFILQSPNGICAAVLTLGGILQSLFAPDRQGTFDNVTLGCRSVAEYLEQRAYLGAIIGRNANRLAEGRFTIDGTEHHASINDPPHSLHGGADGFDRRVWLAVPFAELRGAGLLLAHTSPDGDQGFPGTVRVWVRYFVTDEELRIDYLASTDRPTVINLTNHAYWNLSGDGSRSVEDHVLWINAQHMTPVDADLIPTGAIEEVGGTAFDFFSRPQRIGTSLRDPNPQLRNGQGYDHHFVLDRPSAESEPSARLAARLFDPDTGRVLEVLTTENGVQFYSGNRLDGTIVGTNGTAYHRHSGLALETQAFPDAPNHPQFPTTVLRPGRHFRSTTVYRLTTAK
jgi:aldose 1-epimerase